MRTNAHQPNDPVQGASKLSPKVLEVNVPAAIDLTDVVFREKTISGSMSGYGLYDETIRIMTDPRFRGDLLITDRIGLDDLIGKGYHGLLNEKDKHVKMLVRPE